MKNKVVIITAGGTGGHIMPAVAMAKQLAARGLTVVWVGGNRSLDYALVEDKSWVCIHLPVRSVRVGGVFFRVYALVSLMVSLVLSLGVLLKYRPKAVVSFGGYASFPVALMAGLCGFKLFISEQNSVLGWSNRLLAMFAYKIMTAFPNVIHTEAWKKKTVHCGNSLREEIWSLAKIRDLHSSKEKGDVNILVLGGSQGAGILNQALPSVISHLSTFMPRSALRVFHQCGRGERRVATVSGAYRALGVNASVFEYSESMEIYAKADFVIARSGALTVSELAALKIPACLVPLSKSADNHQYYNALLLKRLGACILVSETEFDQPEQVAKRLLVVVGSSEMMVRMRKRYAYSGLTDETHAAIEAVLRSISSDALRQKSTD